MQRENFYYRTNEQINYFISNREVLLNCIDEFVEKDLLASTEFFESFTDLYRKMDQNFVELYKQKSEKLSNHEPTSDQRLFFSNLDYMVGDCSTLLKPENDYRVDETKLVKRIKNLRKFSNIILKYQDSN